MRIKSLAERSVKLPDVVGIVTTVAVLMPYAQDVGGMQIDVFKSYATTVTFRCNRPMGLFKSPAQEGLKPGDSLSMHDDAR